MNKRFALGLAACALVACGGPFDTGGDNGTTTSTTGPSATAPQVTVVAPDDHHEFEFEDEDDHHHGDDNFDVEVHLEHANLAEPGKCSGSGSCGHLVLLVDGVACGNPNSSSSKPKFKGKFGRCVTVSGPHQIVVQLVDDHGNVLASTHPVTVDVKFKGHRGGDDDGD